MIMQSLDILSIGKILSASGIKGDLKLFISPAYKEYLLANIKSIKIFFDEGELVKLIYKREQGKFAIFRMEEVNDRTEAEKFVGKSLFCLKKDLPELGEEEFYYADLIGRLVYESSTHIGGIVNIMNYGASDIIEIRLLSGEHIMYPFIKDIFLSIDKDKIVIKSPKIV